MTISIPALPSLAALIAAFCFGWGFVDKDELPIVIFFQFILAVIVFFTTYGMCAMV